ncbi:MAG: hypothetical protein EOP06_14465 [Proteobacteria bacterium]|nr:MAG: hypothetical protein EOP06_14465 [Pseudomonadota bacterium]
MKSIFGVLAVALICSGAARAGTEKVKFDLETITFVDGFDKFSMDKQTIEADFEERQNGGKFVVANVPIKFTRPDTQQELSTTFTLFANHTFTALDREEVFSIRTWVEGQGPNLRASPTIYVRLKSFDAFLATLNETKWLHQKDTKNKRLDITVRAEVKNFHILR